MRYDRFASTSLRLALAGITALLSACSDPGAERDEGQPDSGSEDAAGADTAIATAADAATDSHADTDSSNADSTAVDSTTDATTDSAADTDGDSVADTGRDSATDTGRDSATDTGRDASDAATPSDFPGHQPAKIYLGYGVDNANCPAGSSLATEEGYTGRTRLDRFYEGDINSTAQEVSRFNGSLAAGRIAWISFKVAPYTWAQVAAGAADVALRSKAVAYRGVSGPGLVTFHHEPNGDGAAADYVAAWTHILDVWAAAGGTGSITPLPVLNGFFQSYPNGNQGYTDAQMAAWMPDALLKRFRIIGYDVYDGGSYTNIGIPAARTIRKWREWLLRRQAVIADGKKRYLALGEIGVFFGSSRASVTSWSTSSEGEFTGGYPGWDTVWQRLVSYGSGDASYVAVNYFNSIANTRASCDWSLRARRPTTTAGDLACDSGNEQPTTTVGMADATRVTRFAASLASPQVANVLDWRP